jgi:hypothetical protein
MNQSTKGAPKIKRTTPSSFILHSAPDLPPPKAIPNTTSAWIWEINTATSASSTKTAR